MGQVLTSKRGNKRNLHRRYPPEYLHRRPSPSKLLVNGHIYRDRVGRYLTNELCALIHQYYGDCNIVFIPNAVYCPYIKNGDRTYQSSISHWHISPSVSSFHAPYLDTRSLHPRLQRGFKRGVHYFSVLCHKKSSIRSTWDGHKCSLCKSTMTFIGVQSDPSRYYGNYVSSDDLRWNEGDIVTVVLNFNTREVKWYNGTQLKCRRSFNQCTRDYRDIAVSRRHYRFKMRIYSHDSIAHYEIVPTPPGLREGQVLRL